MPVVRILAFLHSAGDGCLGHIQLGEYCVYSTAVNILKHSLFSSLGTLNISVCRIHFQSLLLLLNRFFFFCN